VWVHPVAGLHASVVQGLLSLQDSAGPPTQLPAWQVSDVVQALPSLHAPGAAALIQPVAGLQESAVQTLLSSHTTAEAAVQTPFWHVSPAVQALPSVHGPGVGGLAQPLAGLHVSAVHTLPSLQLGAAPPTQVPAAHVSLRVQALPSLHGPGVGANTQPVAGAQESAVHGLPSAQTRLLCGVHTPAWQVSPVVHAFPSVHGPGAGTLTQPLAALHESAVHTLPSSQLGGGPPTHTPAAQASFVVHALPSLQVPEIAGKMQPTAGSQASAVHGLLSTHATAGPGAHAPATHVSPAVQASPSLQGLKLPEYTQPVAALHESVVQGLPSLQASAAPETHTPAAHVSPAVQALPSEQGAVLGVNTQPAPSAHESVVQGFPSLHAAGAWPTQLPWLHASPVVQALPSSHGSPLGRYTQPVLGLHASVVQRLLSLHSTGVGPVQAPPWH
jgi:hypothetical protein